MMKLWHSIQSSAIGAVMGVEIDVGLALESLVVKFDVRCNLAIDEQKAEDCAGGETDDV